MYKIVCAIKWIALKSSTISRKKFLLWFPYEVEKVEEVHSN